MLSENNTEIVSESEILPFEKDIDFKLRQIGKNYDNSSNITLISYEDVADDKAKLKGSLDKGEVFTNINDKGIVSSIYQSRNTKLMSGYKDEVQDNYVKDNAYINTTFDEGMFEIENETKKQEELSFKIENMSSNNTNLIDLIDDLTDDNGTIIEYFSSIKYEKYDNSVFEKYILEEMGTQFLDEYNSSNVSISTEEYDENTNSLRNLYSVYPYYGQDIIKNIQDIYKKDFLGAVFHKYVETTQYPHNGSTITEIVLIIGSEKNIFSRETTFTNSHIITRNKNIMTNELILSLRKSNSASLFNVIKDEFYSYENKDQEFIGKQIGKFNNFEYLFDDLLSRFYSASEFNNEQLGEIHDIIFGYIEDKNFFFEEKYDKFNFNIYHLLDENKQSYNDIEWDLYDQFHYLESDIQNILFEYKIESNDIPIFNLIYNDLEHIVPKLLKEETQIIKQSKDSFKEFKKQFLNFKQKIKNKGNNFMFKAENFKKDIENVNDNNDRTCRLRKFSIITFLDRLIYFFDNHYYSTDEIINRKEYDYSIDDEESLKEWFKNNLFFYNTTVNELLIELDRKYGDYNYYIFGMKENLNYLYEKLNTHFFENLKDNIDNLYNTLIKFKDDFIRNLYDTKNKLTSYSNEFFSLINEKKPEDESKMDISYFNKRKDLIESSLRAYNNTISDFLNYLKSFDNRINFYCKKIDEGEKINQFIYEIEYNIFSYYKKFYEPQYRQIEIIENYFSKLLDYKEYLNNLTEKLNSILLENNYFETTINLLLISLVNSVYSSLDRIWRIDKETSFFFEDAMEDERKLFNDLYDNYQIMISNIDIPNITVFLDISDSIDKIYNEKISYFNEIKNRTLSSYNPSVLDEINSEKLEDTVNEEYIRALIKYINLYADNIKDISISNEQNNLVISSNELDYATGSLDYNIINEFNQKLNDAFKDISNSILDNILEQKIQPFLTEYEINYNEIVIEFNKIREWNESSFIEYVNKYYNELQDSISFLIDEYIDKLYYSLRYDYFLNDFPKIEDYFKNLINDINSYFYLHVNYSDFGNHIQNKINETIKERKDYFLNFINLNYNGADFEIDLGESKFQAKDYIINKMIEIDDENQANILNNISNYDHNILINELKLAFQNVNKTIVQNFTEKTFDFLNYLHSHSKYLMPHFMLMKGIKKNNRECYDLR